MTVTPAAYISSSSSSSIAAVETLKPESASRHLIFVFAPRFVACVEPGVTRVGAGLRVLSRPAGPMLHPCPASLLGFINSSSKMLAFHGWVT